MTTIPSSHASGNHDINYMMLRAALQHYEKSPKELDQVQLAGLRKQVFKEYKIQNTVLSSVEARDVFVPESVVDSTLTEIQKRYESQDEFYDDIGNHGISIDGLRASLARELKVDTVLERVGSRSVKISDMDIMIYYHMHLQRFQQPETRSVRHILITINPDFEENTRENAKARIDKLRQRLDKKINRFSEQAMKHSECPTAMREGLLGRIPKGELYPELDARLFTMQEGELSEVLESPSGFHLLYCEAIYPEGVASLSEARPKIRGHLEKRASRMCQKSWLAELLK